MPTVAPDEITYVRITGSGKEVAPHIGKVGKAASIIKNMDMDLIFVYLHGEPGIIVFNEKNVTTITEKEYFIGALRG